MNGPESPNQDLPSRLRALAALFLKLGTIAFGGPAAHIAMMETEVVRKRQWLTHEQFLDMLGAANLVPGPTSTEMAINIGFARAGWIGLCVAGASFILPAALITGAFAWIYVRFGEMAQAVTVLAGVKAAVMAIIAIAIWRLGKIAVKNSTHAVLGAVALAAFLLGVSPLVILFGGGVVGMLVRQGASLRTAPSTVILPVARRIGWRLGSLAVVVASTTAATVRPSVTQIGLFFLKVGALLYGGGYVLLAFLERDLVVKHAWMTHQQLLDSVAIGQFTPGPVFSTATFIGYLLGGVPGAAVATVAIFLPSFFYIGLLAPVLFRLRKSPWMAAFMDSVNVCAVALMAGVTIRLGIEALRDWSSWVIAAASLGALLKWKLNPAWIVLGGGIAGLLLAALH